MKNNQYTPIDPKDEHIYEEVCLYRNDFRILHNLCVDVLNDHPEMVSIERIKDKLKMVTDHWEQTRPQMRECYLIVPDSDC